MWKTGTANGSVQDSSFSFHNEMDYVDRGLILFSDLLNERAPPKAPLCMMESKLEHTDQGLFRGVQNGSITMPNNGCVMPIRHFTVTHGSVLKVDRVQRVPSYSSLNVPHL